MYKIIWRIRARLDRFVYDERASSGVRLLFVLSLTLSVILLGYNLFEEPSASHWVEQLLEHYPYLFWAPVYIVRFFHFVFYGFRHMIIPISVFIGVLFASAVYVQDVYELPSFKSGVRYMFAAFLGLGYPRLKIVALIHPVTLHTIILGISNTALGRIFP